MGGNERLTDDLDTIAKLIGYLISYILIGNILAVIWKMLVWRVFAEPLLF